LDEINWSPQITASNASAHDSDAEVDAMLYENKMRKDDILFTKLYGLSPDKILQVFEPLSNGFGLTLPIGQSGDLEMRI
jgi:hypothetical protein